MSDSGRTFFNGTAVPTNCKHASCCTIDICPLEYGFIQHSPNLGGTIFYIAIFSFLLTAQLGLGFFYRTWYFTIAMTCGLILEVLGYIGRLMLRSNPFNFTAFLLYLIPLTIGPAFMCAGIYVCLGRIVVTYGTGLSRVKPSTYTFLFVSSDVLSLVLQAAGGAVTSIAPDSNHKLSQTGINIMIAGLSTQVASLTIFLVLCADFARKVTGAKGHFDEEHRDLWSSRRWRYFLIALTSAVVVILIRSAYRVAELSQGFKGSLANNEITFLILEGCMVSIACLLLTFAYPGYSFMGQWSQLGFNWRNTKETKA